MKNSVWYFFHGRREMLSSQIVQIAPASSRPTASRNTTLYDFCSSSTGNFARATALPLSLHPALHQSADVEDPEAQQHELDFASHALRFGQPHVEGVSHVRDPERLHQLRQIKHAC